MKSLQECSAYFDAKVKPMMDMLTMVGDSIKTAQAVAQEAETKQVVIDLLTKQIEAAKVIQETDLVAFETRKIELTKHLAGLQDQINAAVQELMQQEQLTVSKKKDIELELKAHRMKLETAFNDWEKGMEKRRADLQNKYDDLNKSYKELKEKIGV